MAAGRRQVLPFDDIPPVPGLTIGTEFKFDRSWFHSYLSYERGAREELRRLQRAGWLVERDLRQRQRPSKAVDLRRRRARIKSTERFVRDQIWAAQKAVDTELEEGRGLRSVVEAMRAEPIAPSSVMSYADALSWIESDLRRALPDWPARRGAGGADYGYHWGLENPTRPWQTSRWRISWLCLDEPTYEVYAIELPDRPGGALEGARRLWVLGVLRDRSAVEAALLDLIRNAMRERNSLVTAALAIDRAAALASPRR